MLRLNAFGLRLVLAFSLGASGCATFSVDLEPPEAPLASGTLQVGSAMVELTPPAGVPMGGYGPDGQVSRGFWLRLYARAIYIEDESGDAVVLVATDLWSMSAGLADRVAERVRSDPDGETLGREQILLAATHTHQSPAAFSSSIAYNALAANHPSFDPDLFEFLATRISEAILEARRSRGPATMAANADSLEGWFRNRSMKPFRANPEALKNEVLGESANEPCGFAAPVPDRDACRAVHSRVRVLRFERAGDVLATAVFAASHPTTGGMELAVYSSDVFGVAALEAEQRIAARNASGRRPVVAIFNGAEGDVSVGWERQDATNVRHFGRQLGDAIVRLSAGGTRSADVQVASRFRRFPLANSCYQEPGGTNRCTAATGQMGAAVPGGAPDGRTGMHGHIWHDGITRTPRGPQGGKVPAFDPGFGWFRIPLTWVAFKLLSGPAEVPLGVHRVGDFVLAALPGEFTTAMGHRIRSSLARRAMTSPDRVLLVGLANEYASYFATPEEYTLQHYEGGSTMYGQYAGGLVESRLGELAKELTNPTPRRDAKQTFEYVPGWKTSFDSTNVKPSAFDSDDGLAPLLEASPYGEEGPPYPSVCWYGPAATLRRLVHPEVRIETEEAPGRWRPLSIDGRAQHNRGESLVTLTRGKRGDEAEWRVLWIPPENLDRAQRFRFHVAQGSEEQPSPAFELDDRVRGERCWLHLP